VDSGEVATAELLLSAGADPHGQDNEGMTPFVKSSRAGNVPIFELLLASSQGRRSRELAHALLMACESDDNVDIARALFEEGVDINRKVYGKTPLMKAAGAGSIKMVSFLLAKGANLVEKSREDLSALDYAGLNRHLDVALILLDEAMARNETSQILRPDLHDAIVGIDQNATLSEPSKRLRLATFLALQFPEQNEYSISWLMRAADDGCIEAQSWLGRKMWQDNGTRENYELAYSLLLSASKGGNPTASEVLTGCYLDAETTAFPGMVAWLTNLASHGDGKAQHHLGRRLFVEGKTDDARRWLSKAIGNGQKEAKVTLERIDSLETDQ